MLQRPTFQETVCDDAHRDSRVSGLLRHARLPMCFAIAWLTDRGRVSLQHLLGTLNAPSCILTVVVRGPDVSPDMLEADRDGSIKY